MVKKKARVADFWLAALGCPILPGYRGWTSRIAVIRFANSVP